MYLSRLNRAFTLIEVLFAMVLGIVVITGLLELYLGVQHSYQQQLAFSELQDNGRIASYILAKNIRMVGYSGCVSDRIDNPIKGYSKITAPSYLKNRVAVGDVVVITKADVGISQLRAKIDAQANRILLQNNPASKTQRELLLSDCAHSEIVLAANYGGTTLKLTQPTHYSYSVVDAEIARMTKTAYFIGKTTRVNAMGKPIYALYKVVNHGNKQELIAGVDNMQIKYGVSSSGDGRVDCYLAAKAIHDWSSVLSVFVVLSLQATDGEVKRWPIYVALREHR